METKTQIKGLKKIAGESKSTKGYYGNLHYQLWYNTSTGEAWATEHASRNSWTTYDEPTYICCGWISEPMTMAKIREMIETTLEIEGQS